MVHEPAVLIEGVLFRANYLGSTQIVCEGQPTKYTRMMQAEEAVSRIKVTFNVLINTFLSIRFVQFEIELGFITDTHSGTHLHTNKHTLGKERNENKGKEMSDDVITMLMNQQKREREREIAFFPRLPNSLNLPFLISPGCPLSFPLGSFLPHALIVPLVLFHVSWDIPSNLPVY